MTNAIKVRAKCESRQGFLVYLFVNTRVVTMLHLGEHNKGLLRAFLPFDRNARLWTRKKLELLKNKGSGEIVNLSKRERRHQNEEKLAKKR